MLLPDEVIQMNDDAYDSPWKMAVEQYFPEFMAFFFPAAYDEIDWAAGYEFLDQELQQVVRDAELGRRYVDKLARVRKLDGDEGWVCVHLEVQGEPEDDFARRMFTYHYRLFDRFAKPLASMAVLADDRQNWRPTGYGYDLFGCRMRLDFPVVKLLDKQAQLDTLLESENAFALVTAAHLMTRATRKKPKDRYAAKIRLIRILFVRGWERQRILNLFAVIDWLMRLPADLEQKISDDIRQIEEEHKMQYVTSIERLAREDGMQQGKQQGKAQMLRTLLVRRFGAVPGWADQRIHDADSEQLETWCFRLLDGKSLEDVLKADSGAAT